jgi:pimeloyl-ACP methyl ester carboxylesterase
VTRPGRNRRLVASISCLAASLVAAACSFHELHENLLELDTYGTLHGTVSVAEPASGTIVALVYAGSPGEEHVVDSFVLDQPGAYFFLVPAGRYRVGAFEDRNGNGVYDPGVDPAASYAGGEVSVAGAGVVEGLDLRIGPGEGSPLRVTFALPAAGRREAKRLPEIHVGEVVSLSDPRFARTNSELGLWQPIDFLFDVGAGIFFLEPYDPQKIPVLFVHGALGTPIDFSEIVEHLDRTRFQPWLVYYPTALSIDQLGAGLDRWMQRLYALHRFPRLVVVAHSMGGLVARDFLNETLREPVGGVADALCLFVTISTPWNGQDAAAFGVEHAPAVAPSWHDLVPGNPFLETLLAQALPERIPHHLFFGFGGGSRLYDEANDGVVTVASELAPLAQRGARRLYGFDASHTGILRSPEVAAQLNEILAATAESERIAGP